MLRGSMSCAVQHRQRWRRRAVQRRRRRRRRAVQRRRRPRRCAQFLPPRGGAVDQRYARALPARETFPARVPHHSAETLWHREPHLLQSLLCSFLIHVAIAYR